MANQATNTPLNPENLHALAPDQILPVHPHNGQAITEQNPVNALQIQQLAMHYQINPFELIQACASTEDRAAVKRHANEEGSETREMYTENPPLPAPLEPLPRQDGVLHDRRVIANHYRWVANIEAANHLLLIPYIHAVAPYQQDKNFGAIMTAAFREWIDRVRLFAVQAKASKETPSVPEILALVQKPTTNSRDVPHHWHALSQQAEEKIEHQSRDNLKERWTAEDDVTERAIMKARYICELLKEWTVEWERERATYEKAYFSQDGPVLPAAPGAAPFPAVDPRDQLR